MQLFRPQREADSGATAERADQSNEPRVSRVQPAAELNTLQLSGPHSFLTRAVAAATLAAMAAKSYAADEGPIRTPVTAVTHTDSDPLVAPIRSTIDQVLDGKISSLPTLRELISRASPEARMELSAYLSGRMDRIKPGEARDTVQFLVAAAIKDLVDAHDSSPTSFTDRQEMQLQVKRILAANAIANPKNWNLSTLPAIDRVARGIQILGELGTPDPDFDEVKLLSHLRTMAGKFSHEEIGTHAATELNQLREQQEEQRKSLNESLATQLTSTTPSFQALVNGPSYFTLEKLRPHLTVGKDQSVTLSNVDLGVWTVEPLADLPDRFSLLTLRHQGSSAYVTLPIEELAKLVKDPDAMRLRLDAVLTQNEKDSLPETREPLRRVDLPTNSTAFITVLPEKYDPVVSSQFVPSALLEAELIKKYGSPCEPTLILSNDPLPALRDAIKTAKRRSPEITDVFVQLHNHGSPTGIEFDKRVTGSDLAKLAQEFPDIKLHFMSIACFGGGVTAELERLSKWNPESVSGINFYAHTSPDLIAIAGGRAVIGSRILNDGITSTPYFYQLIVGLANNPEMTLGEVIDGADQASQGIFAVNPESFADGIRVRGLADELPKR